jgi:transcriptional regulator with XRE-family HTH domain
LPALSDPTFKQWVDQCPLRRWRYSFSPHVSIMEAAARLGVSMTLIQLWERGVHIPSGENMCRLQELIGTDTVAEWAEWFHTRPSRSSIPSKKGRRMVGPR